jgi:hypothetical protein
VHLCDALCHNREKWFRNEAAIFTTKIKLNPKMERVWQSRLFPVFCFLSSLRLDALGVVPRGQRVNREFYLAILWHVQAPQNKWLETWWNRAGFFTTTKLPQTWFSLSTSFQERQSGSTVTLQPYLSPAEFPCSQNWKLV